MKSFDIQQQLASILATTNDAIIITDVDGLISSWNSGAETMFGYRPEEMLGQTSARLLPGDCLEQEAQWSAQIAIGETPAPVRTLRLHKDGHTINISATTCAIKDQQGNLGLAIIARDISHEVELELQARRFQALIMDCDDAIISKTTNGLVTSWNRGAEQIFGYSAIEMIGQPMLKLFPADRADEEDFILTEISQGRRVDHFHTQRLSKYGQLIDVAVTLSPIKDADGKIVGVSKIARDISHQVRASEALRRRSQSDGLTGLLTRRSFVEQLANEIDQCQITNAGFALLYIDLDKFKNINDKLGHDFGDLVIKHVAQQLINTLRKEDLIGRIGGDEFLVLLPSVTNRHDASHIAAKIIKVLHQPFEVNNVSVIISASAGISLFPAHGKSAKDLIAYADYALYESKRTGRNTYRLYDTYMQTTISRNQQIAKDLPLAIQGQQLHLVYQPIVALASGKVAKSEALIRWRHPELGLVSPAEFIPVAEENGVICDIGEWVFESAVATLTEWTKRFGKDFQISINKSPVQFRAEDQAPLRWSKYLQNQGLSCKNLIVEITENSLMANAGVTGKKLRDFAHLGIEIAIDDFGTGYSSLAYINRFNLDYIKIDRTFIRRIETHTNDFVVCEGIILLAHKLGLKVVAEGVETEQQHRMLQDIGCDYGQGYWYSKPLAPAEFEAFYFSDNTRKLYAEP
ncbi:putative bifunctional diguanylate cyclase/phosphodiesterase [Halioxenophilus sp. WMMB6]|uniref:putative bifunctional diguanylate cyclase/phosphodiesterase n=1 Tax=Halioxenophilus sp. WMMB6 TaxID=3073815 RepID=UPI00295EF1C3|nr:EAL domain-containing protein [Halioxenophilus sp. WMMB6]